MMQNVLTLSGAHLCPDTWNWLDTHLQEENLHRPKNTIAALLKGGATRYGWFVFCPSQEDVEDHLPGDLQDVMVHARKRGAEYLLFDLDSIPLDDLPILHPDFAPTTDDVGTGNAEAETDPGQQVTGGRDEPA